MKASNRSDHPLKVLLLSRNYPNDVLPQLGLWVEGLTRHIAQYCDPRVIAPVPYFPPLPGFADYSRYRHLPLHEYWNGVEVWHPRFMTGPGYSLHNFEGIMYYWGIRHQVDRIRREFPFDLIHAHFSYPDGFVAARLGRIYRVPVIITEHAPWIPWMEKYPRVARHAVWASGECKFHIAVSHYVLDTIVQVRQRGENLRVLPVGVDTSVFTPLSDGRVPNANQIVYVGFMRHVKGVDLLLRAMHRLVQRFPNLRLVVVGGGFYRKYRLEEERLRHLSQKLGLGKHVEFVGLKQPHEVAEVMRESALLVLPSRAESFGAVLVEALASGIPVVATRCGGPEEIVTEDVGVLVPPEDSDGLAKGLEAILDHRERYKPGRLRNYALLHFDWELIASRTVELYQQAAEQWPCGDRANLH